MALVDPRTTKEIESIEKFEGLLREGWAKPWWREFVKLIEQRKMKHTNELILGVENGTPMNDREEDITRGWILALSWIIAIDAQGRKLHDEETSNG